MWLRWTLIKDSFYFSGFFKYSKWKFGRCRMVSRFKIEEGKPTGYVFLPEFEASSNQFMKSKASIFYVNDELISELEGLLSDEAIDKFIKSKTENVDLFN